MIWDGKKLQSDINVIMSLNPSFVLGPCVIKEHAINSQAKFIRNMLIGTSVPWFSMHFVNVRDVAKRIICAFDQRKDVLSDGRFI
jgi:nucleoside-diphosphate-sugar epimerase